MAMQDEQWHEEMRVRMRMELEAVGFRFTSGDDQMAWMDKFIDAMSRAIAFTSAEHLRQNAQANHDNGRIV